MALIILLLFVVIIGTLLLAAGSVALVNGQAVLERSREQALSTWRTALGADLVTELRANTALQITPSDVARRQSRLQTILQPPGTGTMAGITLSGLSLGSPSSDPWNKGNSLSQVATLGLFHPWGRSPILEFQQTIAATLTPDAVMGAKAASITATFGTWASSDVGLVVLDAYSAGSGPSLAVTGTALLAGGFTASNGTTRLSADIVASPSGTLVSGQAGKTIFGTRVAVHPYYAISWGTSALTLVLPVNNPGSLAWQTFFDRSTTVVNVVNGTAIGAMPSGVSIAEYPIGSGVQRVKVDLAVLGPLASYVYINLLSATDQANGIAVLGASSAAGGQHAVVATNGTVRLSGNNVMPAVVASSGSVVYCEDLTAGGSLAQTWVGSLFFPAATTYQTGQAGAGAVLSVQGSLVTGAPSGNLPSISIVETRNSTIRNDGPRFISLRALR